jgi:hypothetical protein
VLCIGGLKIVIFYVPSVFSKNLAARNFAGLTYVCFITGFTCQLVYAALVVVLCDVKVWFVGVLY